MTSKEFTFHEAMKDSPNFRFELGQHERYFDRVQKRLEETIRSIETAMDHGQIFISSFYNLTVSLNRLWLDMEIDESREKSAVETYKQLSDFLSQILNLNRSLVEHAYPTLKAGFDSYLKRELGKLTEVKTHFKSLSSSLAEALSKKAAISKHKVQDLHDAENELTARGTCFSHTGLDYMAQINISHALKCPALLEALWVFVKEYGNFFTRGNQLFAEQQELLIGDEVTRMRAAYKQIERKMQDRHTFVPKEIFQHPSGIPIDPRCIMEGYLFKRATNAFKTWNRRWFMIKDGKLLYSHKTNDGEPEVPTVMEDNLKLCLVRPAPAAIDRACCFELVTPTRSHLLQADSESLCSAWIRALQRTIQNLHEDDHGSYAQSRKSFIGSIEPCSSSIAETISTIGSLNGDATLTKDSVKQIAESHSSAIHSSEALSSSSSDTIGFLPSSSSSSRQHDLSENAKQTMKLFLKELLAVPGNDRCADCGCPDAKWTSLNLGVIICIECSGVHRSLGVHFSKVRSLTMDNLESEHRNILLQLGNRKVNSIFLHNLPTTDEAETASSSSNTQMGISRHTNRESREQWIIAKYVEKKFAFQQQHPTTIGHSRSDSTLSFFGGNLTAPTQPPEPASTSSSSVVKLRNSKIVQHLQHDHTDLLQPLDHLPSSYNESSSLSQRLSRNSSFGSDSNLVQQSARAAIAQRASSQLVTTGASSRSAETTIREGNLAELLRWIVQGQLDINAHLEGPSDIGHNTQHHKTPLHIAVENNQRTMIEFLLLNGAKINAVDGKQNTPLHLAAERGRTIIIYQLLKRNAEKALRNADGKTALELAVEKRHADIVTLLRLHDMKEEFNDDQNSTLDETVESFIGDLTSKQEEEHLDRDEEDEKKDTGLDPEKTL